MSKSEIELSPFEHQVLASLKDLTHKMKCPPTLQELGDHLGHSKQSIASVCYRLRAYELITWHPNKSRTLRVVEKSPARERTDRIAALEARLSALEERVR